MSKHYWGYRIDTNQIYFFRKELEAGILRQGWGWHNKQDLRNLKMDEGARRNLSIYKKVKKDDVLIIPRCPSWDEVSIAIATEDFDKGYNYHIDEKLGDYGHCFPAKLLKTFVRKNEKVSGQLRATIKNISRFWNIDHCEEDIEKLINEDSINLMSKQSYEKSFGNAVHDSFEFAFNEKQFNEKIYETVAKKFSNEEWEFALVEGLKSILPEPIIVERTGGKSEALHGTDILIRLPGLLGFQYLIAIQVKDYFGKVGKDPIKQISKADNYWNNENCKVVDKYVIITKANKDDNERIIENQNGVKIIFINEVKELLSIIGKAYLGFDAIRI